MCTKELRISVDHAQIKGDDGVQPRGDCPRQQGGVPLAWSPSDEVASSTSRLTFAGWTYFLCVQRVQKLCYESIESHQEGMDIQDSTSQEWHSYKKGDSDPLFFNAKAARLISVYSRRLMTAVLS